jgi:hypothetical protein
MMALSTVSQMILLVIRKTASHDDNAVLPTPTLDASTVLFQENGLIDSETPRALETFSGHSTTTKGVHP